MSPLSPAREWQIWRSLTVSAMCGSPPPLGQLYHHRRRSPYVGWDRFRAKRFSSAGLARRIWGGNRELCRPSPQGAATDSHDVSGEYVARTGLGPQGSELRAGGVGKSTDTAGLGTCATRAVVGLRSELQSWAWPSAVVARTLTSAASTFLSTPGGDMARSLITKVQHGDPPGKSVNLHPSEAERPHLGRQLIRLQELSHRVL